MSKKSRYSLNKNKYLLRPEVDQLTYLLKSHLETDRRNCVLLFLALHTGGRAQELLNLELHDLDDHHKTIFIRGIKGSNDREIPLPDWLYRELGRVIADRQFEIQALQSSGDASAAKVQRKSPKMNGTVMLEARRSPRIFPITYNRAYQIWALYRPVEKKFHSLRHTFAIRLYRKTKDIRLLQVALGHRNITNTMIYADYVYSQEELRRLIL